MDAKGVRSQREGLSTTNVLAHQNYAGRNVKQIGADSGHTVGRTGAIPGLTVLRTEPDNNLDAYTKDFSNYGLRTHGDLGQIFKTKEYPIPEEVVATEEMWQNKAQAETLKELLKERARQIAQMKADRPKLQAAMWGNMSADSQARVRQHAKWVNIETQKDPLALWIAIVETHMFNSVGNSTIDKATARDNYNNIRQAGDETLAEYKDRFDYCVNALKAAKTTVPDDADQAIDFINRLGMGRYATFKANLQNNVHLGANNFPTTLVAAYNMAARYQVVRTTATTTSGTQQTVFVVKADDLRGAKGGNGKAGTEGNEEKKTGVRYWLRCYLCDGAGHKLSECPELKGFKEYKARKDEEEGKKNNNNEFVNFLTTDEEHDVVPFEQNNITWF